jgi:hypothetical protein
MLSSILFYHMFSHLLCHPSTIVSIETFPFIISNILCIFQCYYSLLFFIFLPSYSIPLHRKLGTNMFSCDAPSAASSLRSQWLCERLIFITVAWSAAVDFGVFRPQPLVSRSNCEKMKSFASRLFIIVLTSTLAWNRIRDMV